LWNMVSNLHEDSNAFQDVLYGLNL
jgi:hypothetical protein